MPSRNESSSTKRDSACRASQRKGDRIVVLALRPHQARSQGTASSTLGCPAIRRDERSNELGRIDLPEQSHDLTPRFRVQGEEVEDVGPILGVPIAVTHETGRDRVAVGSVANQCAPEMLAS
jgi:hypothetical protein